MSRGVSANTVVSEIHHSEKEVRDAAIMSSPRGQSGYLRSL